MRPDHVRRTRHRKARRTRARDLAVLAYPARGDEPRLVFGPFQGAMAVSLRELSNGRKVQIVPFDRVRALESA